MDAHHSDMKKRRYDDDNNNNSNEEQREIPITQIEVGQIFGCFLMCCRVWPYPLVMCHFHLHCHSYGMHLYETIFRWLQFRVYFIYKTHMLRLQIAWLNLANFPKSQPFSICQIGIVSIQFHLDFVSIFLICGENGNAMCSCVCHK